MRAPHQLAPDRGLLAQRRRLSHPDLSHPAPQPPCTTTRCHARAMANRPKPINATIHAACRASTQSSSSGGAVLSEEDLDRELHRGGEREGVGHGPERTGKELQGQDEAGEEHEDQPAHLHGPPDVVEPEGAQGDEEAKGEADAQGQAQAQGEGGPDAGPGREPEVEDQGADGEGRDAPGHQLEPGPAEVLGQPPRLEVERPVQVADHVAQDDAVGQLVGPERSHGRQQSLGDERERDRVGGVEAADVTPVAGTWPGGWRPGRSRTPCW